MKPYKRVDAGIDAKLWLEIKEAYESGMFDKLAEKLVVIPVIQSEQLKGHYKMRSVARVAYSDCFRVYLGMPQKNGKDKIVAIDIFPVYDETVFEGTQDLYHLLD